MISLPEVLLLATLLFCISVAGIFLNRKNVLILLMCIELMLLSVNINFIAFSHFLGDIHGQVFVFLFSQWLRLSLRLDSLSWLSCFVTGIRLMSVNSTV